MSEKLPWHWFCKLFGHDWAYWNITGSLIWYECKTCCELRSFTPEELAPYRKTHDLRGDDSPATGRAWDQMRKAGDKARAALAAMEGEK